ncbi:hypothetical protein ABZ318_26360, partial [Streptomyces sp. NPDC006197]
TARLAFQPLQGLRQPGLLLGARRTGDRDPPRPFGRRRATVTSRTREDNRAEIEVGNTGPEAQPYEVPTLFEPLRHLGTEPLVTAPVGAAAR